VVDEASILVDMPRPPLLGWFYSTILLVVASENDGVRIGVVWRTMLFGIFLLI